MADTKGSSAVPSPAPNNNEETKGEKELFYCLSSFDLFYDGYKYKFEGQKPYKFT